MAVCALGWAWLGAAEPNEPNRPRLSAADSIDATATVIPCKGMIDEALYHSIERRSETAMAAGATYLIYEVSSYGGFVNAADDIAKYFIQTVGDRATTVAYVTTEAISAGALISVSCNDIVMRRNSTIGDCAPIMLGGKLEGVEREKVESFIRARFQTAAEANGYPELLLKAMVTMQTQVHRVRNLATNEYEFFEGDNLPTDANAYDVENAEEIVGDDELLTLTDTQALEYGVARAVVDDRQGVLTFLAERDDVTFVGAPRVLNPTWSEQMVSWLNSPAVAAILFMLMLLGAYIEFSTPGVGLPGLVAVICLALILGSKHLVGLANWVEIALFFLGIALLLIEFLVLPGFGIAGMLGIACLLGGLFGMLIRNTPDELPWPETPMDWRIFNSGVLGLAFGFVGFVFFAWLLSRFLPKLQFLSGLVLVPTTGARAGGKSRISMTAPHDDAAAGLKVGDRGKVTSRLRPAGKARFGGAMVDVVATGEFLDAGTTVEIVEIHGNRVVVKPAMDKEAGTWE
jgi:membrane-bound serine protease (ClpP class)